MTQRCRRLLLKDALLGAIEDASQGDDALLDETEDDKEDGGRPFFTALDRFAASAKETEAEQAKRRKLLGKPSR